MIVSSFIVFLGGTVADIMETIERKVSNIIMIVIRYLFIFLIIHFVSFFYILFFMFIHRSKVWMEFWKSYKRLSYKSTLMIKTCYLFSRHRIQLHYQKLLEVCRWLIHVQQHSCSSDYTKMNLVSIRGIVGTTWGMCWLVVPTRV